MGDNGWLSNNLKSGPTTLLKCAVSASSISMSPFVGARKPISSGLTPWFTSTWMSSGGTGIITRPHVWQTGVAGLLERQYCNSVLHLLSSYKGKFVKTRPEILHQTTLPATKLRIYEQSPRFSCHSHLNDSRTQEFASAFRPKVFVAQRFALLARWLCVCKFATHFLRRTIDYCT